MRILEDGHIYELNELDRNRNDESRLQRLTFVAREPHNNRVHAGTTTQEVIRALISRTKYCDNCLRWDGNDQIIYHLRMALVLHEARALIRKQDKGAFNPEEILIDEKDGHFFLTWEGVEDH